MPKPDFPTRGMITSCPEITWRSSLLPGYEFVFETRMLSKNSALHEMSGAFQRFMHTRCIDDKKSCAIWMMDNDTPKFTRPSYNITGDEMRKLAQDGANQFLKNNRKRSYDEPRTRIIRLNDY